MCGMCGTQLASPVAQEVRKTVTVVFCDLKGSTSLGERLDTESLREVLNVYFREMQTVLERHGGTVEKFIGDAIMAVFGLPTVREDDALRAVRAAFEMKQTLAKVNQTLEAGWGVRLENRTGVNTGEVVAGDVTSGQRLVTGDTVNTAARLEQAAPALEILIGESTRRLVKDAVTVEAVEPLELKGKAERVPAYRLISVTREEGVARRLHAPMVGREGELRRLLDALDRARQTRRPQLVTVFGPAGTGKSRLIREYLDRAGSGVTALRGRCLSYGNGITFWPLSEALRSASDIGDDDSLEQAKSKLHLLLGEGNRDVAEKLEAAIGFSTATISVEEITLAVRRCLEILSSRRPLILDIEDIHWAEPTLLDLLRYVVDFSVEAPVVVVCSSRRDILEEHPEWGQERENAATIMLEPLSDEESSTVVENMLGSGALDQRVRERIIQAAEGNPLFVEQMLSMLIDDGIVARGEGGDWVLISDPGTITIPPTISALLTARLDRLGSAERSVVERGSVIGQIFFRGALEQLVSDAVRPEVARSLSSLVRKEMILPHEQVFAGQETFKFSHILIRDAAYHGLLKRTRAELHERFVDWLEQVSSDRIMEYEEIRGFHLEQAYLTLIQLGAADDHVESIGRRGSGYLSSAGRRAMARGDVPAAGNLLHRAASLLPQGDPDRPKLLVEAGDALVETGDLRLAEAVWIKAREEAIEHPDRATELAAQVELMFLRLSLEPDPLGVQERIMQEVQDAIPVLEELGDHEGLARAWRALANVHIMACRWRGAEEAFRQMIDHAKAAENELMERRILFALALCARYGPTPVEEVIALCRDILERTKNDRKTTALTLNTLAHLEAMQGRFEVARELYPRSRAELEELGWRRYAALVSLDSGPIELLAGDPVAAEAELRKDFEALDAMGDSAFLPTTAGYLAEALFRQGRDEEAEHFTRVSEERAAADDILSQVLWRSVRGKFLARSGRSDQAEQLGREAVRLIEDTEDTYTQGNTLMDLAEILILCGKDQEAADALTAALAVLELKGNLAAQVRARSLLASLEERGTPPRTQSAVPDAVV